MRADFDSVANAQRDAERDCARSQSMNPAVVPPLDAELTDMWWPVALSGRIKIGPLDV